MLVSIVFNLVYQQLLQMIILEKLNLKVHLQLTPQK